MGISGNLKTMALAELLQWLSQGSKTGTLVINGESEIQKKIFFKGGAIIGSASTDPKEYLGHFLAGQGYITKEQADEAVRKQKAEKKLIGQIFVEMEVIAADDLKQVLQLKAEESIYDVFTWDQADFHFLDNELPDEHMVPMHLDVQWIVLEGSRRMDEWSRIRESVPSDYSIPVAMLPTYEGLGLEEFEERILSWIDDERTVEEISQGAQVTLFQIAQIMADQVQAGRIKVIKPRTIEVKVHVPSDQAGAPRGDDPATAAAAEMQAQFMQQMMQMQQMQMQQMQQMQPSQQNPPSGSMPAFNPNQPSSRNMGGGRTLNFAGAPPGGPPASGPPASGTGNPPTGGSAGGANGSPPSAGGSSDMDGLLMQIDNELRSTRFQEAAVAFRKARQLVESSPSLKPTVDEVEGKFIRALDRAGVKLSSVPKLKVDMGQLTQLDISPQEGFMLTRVDGSFDIGSILKMSPMPKIDALMLFWKLHKSGEVGF